MLLDFVENWIIGNLMLFYQIYHIFKGEEVENWIYLCICLPSPLTKLNLHDRWIHFYMMISLF